MPSKTAPKTHIDRPTNERRMLCGKEKGLEAKSPGKATCIPCSRFYEINKTAYSKTKRATTAAANKAKKAVSSK